MSLTPERWQEVLRLFDAASTLPHDEHEAFLARECGDSEILAEVRRMLTASSSEDFLEPPPLEEPAAGRDLGDFTLLHELGRGGMGVVYRALQRPLKRIVAVKVLPASFALAQRQVDRFLREARAAARLSHPNLVAVLTVGVEHGVRFFAMEFVDGHNLQDEILRLRSNLAADENDRAHLPSSHATDYFRSVAECVRQVADGLSYAHEHQVIHRDVKPSNLLLDAAGRVKLVDFGLARDEEQGSLSHSGDVLGTPHYMSPEQARAHKHKVDHRTDIYSLGVVLFELLTLQRPFEGKSSQEVIHNLLSCEPPRLRKLNPRVPRDLETICLTAMAKEPGDRYQNAAALRDDLQRFLSHEAIVARPPGAVRRLWRLARRHAVPLGAGVVLLSGAGGGAYWSARTIAADQRADERRLAVELDNVFDWAAVDDERLRDVRRALSRQEDDASPADRELFTRLEQRFLELKRSWSEEALARIERGKHARPAEEVGATDDSEVLSGFLLLTRALKVFPEDAELFRLVSIEVFYPRVSIRAQDEAGRELTGVASYRELDQGTGQPGPRVVIGPLPSESHTVRPGFYRFAVELEDGRFREFTRLLRRAEDLEPIVCTIKGTQDLFPGMRHIDGDVLRFRATPALDEFCPFLGIETPVAPFWIDEAEVSIAEYRRFLSQTGRPPPYEWQWLPADSLHDERPAAAVSWREAVAYAEWAGKRLVSHAEWELAARGPGGALFSRESSTVEDSYSGTVFGPNEPLAPADELFRRFLVHTTPVRAAEGLGRNGLYHMLGNVFEWTETLGFDLAQDDTTFVARPGVRLLLGSAWQARARGHTLATHRVWGPDRVDANAEHGFRCIRSESP